MNFSSYFIFLPAALLKKSTDCIYKKKSMMNKIDDPFKARADEYIDLANKQLAEVDRGKVSASMMFGLARFNAWVAACEFNDAREMSNAKAEMIKYFVAEYEKMLTEHLEDYIAHFEQFMK
jgi:hypothetical protein